MCRNSFRKLVALSLATTLGCGAGLAAAREQAPVPAKASSVAVPAPPAPVTTQKSTTESAPEDNDETDSAVVEGKSVETIRERSTQGQVRVLRQVAQDADGNYQNHGVWKRWDADGHLIAVGDYRDGQRHGDWEQVLFAEHTSILKQAPYLEFAGPFLSEAHFERGKLHGLWKISDVDGRKISEIELASGNRHGKALWYHPNGQRSLEIHYVDGVIEGDIVRWNNRGVEISRKAFRQGREIVVRTVNFENGQPKSQYTTLSPTLIVETPDDWARTEFVKYQVSGESVKQGKAVQFHPNGQKAMEGVFEANEPAGRHTWWHENGQKSIEGGYRDGKPDGAWTWWHPEGPKSTQGEYADGTPVGEWVWWNLEGKIVQRASLGSASSPSHVASPADQIHRPISPKRATLPEPPEPGSTRRR